MSDSVSQYHTAVLDAAERGTLVLTVNKRLSRHLSGLFAARMQDKGRRAWRTPEIVDLDLWLQQVLARLGEDCRLLKQAPALRLWEEIIEGDAAGAELGLLQVAATAKRAMAAHQLLTEYDADIAGLPLTEDHAAFLRWRQKYLEACRDGGWLDSAEVARRICDAIRQGELPAPARVLLVGFDELTPKVQTLCTVFAAAGAIEEIPPLTEPCGDLVRVPCADIEDEVRCAARWARRLLESGAERIGVIVPDLQRYRPLIERVFSAEIDPGAFLAQGEEETRFSLSLGSKLSDHGLVVAAFEILAAGNSLPLDRVSFLLRTPYLGGSQVEACDRALLERRLRSFRGSKFQLDGIEKVIAGTGAALPQLAKVFAVVATGLKEKGKRSPGEWATFFSGLLEQVGWPGGRPLGSLEYQVFKDWREKLLPAMVSLDAVSAPMERGAALSLLRRLAAEIIFQPETPDGPLHVVGHLEAGGLHFEHLWVLGLTEDALPSPPRPTPFLPVSLQVERGMPHAGAARELDFARKVARRLFAAAPRVVLSHPCREGDCELRPSPLIAQVTAGEAPLAPVHAPEFALRRQVPLLEERVDGQAPPLRAGEKTSGGTAILKDQALCPFRAFAHHRLAARALDRPEVGIDLGTRGTLLHTVLEVFWEGTETHAALLALADEELVARIEQSIATAIEKLAADKKVFISPPLLDLERRRLAVLVREWLETAERERAPFRVAEREEERIETFGGLSIKTVVDRIDELGDGSRVIVDYKTGRVELDGLLGERLLEPQLPVYAGGEGPGSLAGVAFASVRRGECAFKGVAGEDGLLPGVESVATSKLGEKQDIADWPGLLVRWRSQLETLGDEFVRGDAAVFPADPKKACPYCDLRPLCRIDEFDLLTEPAE